MKENMYCPMMMIIEEKYPACFYELLIMRIITAPPHFLDMLACKPA